MGRNIWVIGNDRQEMIEAQRRINSTGGMRAVCKLSLEAVQRSIEERRLVEKASQEWREAPSLIMVCPKKRTLLQYPILKSRRIWRVFRYFL